MTKQLLTAITTPTHFLTAAGTAEEDNIGYSTPAQSRSGMQVSSRIRTITVTIDGGGSALTTGLKLLLPQIPITGTIVSWALVADVSGSVVLDIWKANAAVPTNSNSITASAKPTLSSTQLASSSTLTGWTTSIAVGDVWGFEVESATTVTRVVLRLEIQETHS